MIWSPQLIFLLIKILTCLTRTYNIKHKLQIKCIQKYCFDHHIINWLSLPLCNVHICKFSFKNPRYFTIFAKKLVAFNWPNSVLKAVFSSNSWSLQCVLCHMSIKLNLKKNFINTLITNYGAFCPLKNIWRLSFTDHPRKFRNF